MRLHEFLEQNRGEVIARCRDKVRERRAPRATNEEIERGIPLFLDQLIETLRANRARNPDAEGIATRHGGNLMNQGFTVAQVVHDYGDVCQAVTELAIATGAPISAEDFRTLNRCQDDATADAVTEFSRLHDAQLAAEGNQRLGVFAHEARNLVNTANLSFEVLKSGGVGINGSTGAVLERSLTRLVSLVASSLAELRLEVGNVQRTRIEVCRLLEETEAASSLAANAKKIALEVTLPAVRTLAVDGDPQILSSILVNLVQNAIKFTPRAGHVLVRADAAGGRVRIHVEDQCGGLPPGKANAMMEPFQQQGADRTGLGLGLFIARRGAVAHRGEIAVQNRPGTGCIFTLDLPIAAAAPPA